VRGLGTYLRCFFFQAEVGIRDFHVTGVQTCALPISHGNATAGGAYQVALSDYIVLVKGHTQLFLAGPPLLKAATGAWVEAEELRSEERRVGKDRRASPCSDHEVKHNAIQLDSTYIQY